MAQVTDTKNKSPLSIDEKLKKLMDKGDKNFVENESFETRWAKGIPAEEVFDRLEKKVKDLWKK